MTKQKGERVALDAYWTPPEVALACCRAIAEVVPFAPFAVLEPCVGGGAWVWASHQVWPRAVVDGMDIDPTSPGLTMVNARNTGDFLTSTWPQQMAYNMVLGNPPYDGAVQWVEKSLRLAPVVGFLLRSTFLGSAKRHHWWKNHPPAYIWTLDGRPKWEGGNTHKSGDSCDTDLVLWIRGQTDTRHRWLEVP